MKRQLLILFALAAALSCASGKPAMAANGHAGGHGPGRAAGFGRGGRGIGGLGGIGCFGGGFGFGGGCGSGCWDIAELYNQLYNNLPYFALHPPVYYSDIVPRPYGYSPFAYPPEVMTPEFACAAQPVTIDNPYVPAIKSATPPTGDVKADRSAATEPQQAVQPLVITNPYCTQSAVAQADR